MAQLKHISPWNAIQLVGAGIQGLTDAGDKRAARGGGRGGGGRDRKERTARAGSDGKEVKTTSKNSLTHRPYTRYLWMPALGLMG